MPGLKCEPNVSRWRDLGFRSGLARSQLVQIRCATRFFQFV